MTLCPLIYHAIRVCYAFLNNLNDYDEILIVGSGKGVVSVSSIEKNLWRRKSTKLFNKLVKIYKSEVKNN